MTNLSKKTNKLAQKKENRYQDAKVPIRVCLISNIDDVKLANVMNTLHKLAKIRTHNP
jgi:hypothetical protein